ncbi:hypothetical protein PTTG_09912, partial [Puccinia triticina 1-1 BBBD Race 1]|uniref:Uncharacterized protein n=1 Tax=Puccinia triticina (isolate 1-1 / race 1 (BBBD)) TaxID=630390 RepID=A0A0C4F9N1_PUCT1
MLDPIFHQKISLPTPLEKILPNPDLKRIPFKPASYMEQLNPLKAKLDRLRVPEDSTSPPGAPPATSPSPIPQRRRSKPKTPVDFTSASRSGPAASTSKCAAVDSTSGVDATLNKTTTPSPTRFSPYQDAPTPAAYFGPPNEDSMVTD